jgi:lipopolysaccharide biosynthesis regulator YciM
MKQWINQKNVKHLFFLLGLWLSVNSNVSGQNTDIELANQYLKNGEYEKADVMYKKLVKKKESVNIVHQNYLRCLVAMKETDEAEKYLRKRIKSDEDITLLADMDLLLDQIGKQNESQVFFNQAKLKVKVNVDKALILGDYYKKSEYFDKAIQVFNETRDEQKNKTLFTEELITLYRITDQKEKLIDELLESGKLIDNKQRIQIYWQDELKDESEVELFEKVIYAKVQTYPNEAFYTDVLIGFLVKQKEFYKAFVQAKALDRRLKQDGKNVIELGYLAFQNKDFKASGQIFEYLVKEYPQSQHYPVCKRLLINSKEEVVKNIYPIDENDIRLLINEYNKLILEVGKTSKTLDALRNVAQLHAFYLNEKDKAIDVLEMAIKVGGQDREFVDKCKIDLGDIYLLKNESWEATLLYSQVEKSEKDAPLGYEAKLKNAKLHYFKGEFDLAKDILDVLKIATTREISNDAIELSLLIQDNIGLDSNENAMKEYAAIELLLYQNQIDSVLINLNDMFKRYKQHPLADEIVWLRAKTLIKINRIEEAITDLEKIETDFQYDILADDAKYTRAVLIEENKKDKKKAMELYKEILLKFPSSVYASEARKRFRQLRGDTL